MRKRCMAGLFILLLTLSSCAIFTAQKTQPPEGAYRVYFAVTGERASVDAVDYEYRILPEGAPPIRTLAEAILAGPGTADLVSPLPGGVSVRSAHLGIDGQLHLDLSERYGGLSGIDLTIANACFALTFCQIPGVVNLYITVEGEPIPYQNLQTLRPEDLVLPTPNL
ncbi:MAG: GerMN domain-containing protein [Pseudoflavonifractor sp.]